MKKSPTTEYNGIFKSTFLFGFVQLFNIIIKIVTNKIVAVLLGAEGMGVIGIFNSTVNMLKIGAGLGVSQTAVRDISEATLAQNHEKISRIISLSHQILQITGLVGLIISVLFSSWISDYTMGDENHYLSFAVLGIAVALGIYADGQLAILRGSRRLRDVAKASMLGSVIGLITTAPLYYILGKSGIVPSLIIVAMTSVLCANHFVRKIQYRQVKFTLKEMYLEASPMLKMGISLMLVSFLTSVVVLIISGYIRSVGGITEVGYYNAGSMILVGYFGIVMSALSADYYPRIAAIYQENDKLQEELNKQSAVSLVLVGPLMVAFIFMLPLFVETFFSSDFFPVIDYISMGIFGVFITVCSNQVDMILVAKYEVKTFIIISLIYRLIEVALTIFLYKQFGLLGVGISNIVLGIVHLIIMVSVVYKLYGIIFNKFFVRLAVTIFAFILGASFVSFMDSGIYKYILGVMLMLISVKYSLFVTARNFNIHFFQLLKKKLKV